MYIESYWIVIAAIWIIYLLWRTSRWNKTVKDLNAYFDELRKEKSQERRCLWRQITEADKKLLKGVPSAKRKEFLTHQAMAILSIAEETIYVDEYKAGQFIHQETFIVEGSPYEAIDHFFGSETAMCEEEDERINSLYKALEKIAK